MNGVGVLKVVDEIDSPVILVEVPMKFLTVPVMWVWDEGESFF